MALNLSFSIPHSTFPSSPQPPYPPPPLPAFFTPSSVFFCTNLSVVCVLFSLFGIYLRSLTTNICFSVFFSLSYTNLSLIYFLKFLFFWLSRIHFSSLLLPCKPLAVGLLTSHTSLVPLYITNFPSRFHTRPLVTKMR